jgi:hypothetical protein
LATLSRASRRSVFACAAMSAPRILNALSS